MTVPYNAYAHGAALAKARLWWDLSGDQPQMRTWVKCSTCNKATEAVNSYSFYKDPDHECLYFCDLDVVCARCGLISGYRLTVPASMFYRVYPDDADQELRLEED